MRRRVALLIVTAALILLPCGTTIALERLQRRFGVDEGLFFSEINDLAQDTRGFLWIATAGGLFRYDGQEMRPWPRLSPRPCIRRVVAGPGGGVLGVDCGGALVRVAGDDLLSVERPEGTTPNRDDPVAWDATGALCLVSSSRLWRQEAKDGWREIPASRFDGERPVSIEPDEPSEDRSLLLITSAGVWRLPMDGEPVRVAAIERAAKAIRDPGGDLVVLRTDGRVVRVVAGVPGEAQVLLPAGIGRPIDLARRGETIWVSYDTGLVALRRDAAPEVLASREEVPSGGPLLVDREGSLWLGTYRGLRQFPAPDTVAYGEGEGLPSTGVRRLALSSEGLWVDTWSGLALLRRDDGRPRAETIANTGTSALCSGADGTVWAASPGRFLERRAGGFIEHPRAGLTTVVDCDAGGEGRVWLATNLGLTLARPGHGGASAHLLEDRPEPSEPKEVSHLSLLEDTSGALWVAEDDRICRAPADRIAGARGATETWTCADLPSAGAILDLAQLPSGSIWAATLDAGVLRYESGADRWTPIPGSNDLGTRLVRRIRLSPSGGAWVVSFGTLVRVVEREDAAGWEIAERPSTWQGLMIRDAEDVLEEPDGDLWIATLAGVVHVPSLVRRAAPDPPPVEVVEVSSDGERLPTPAAGDEVPRLPWRRNRIELRFAALSFRDPSLLRYQIRLHPDAPWSETTGPPIFRFAALAPGEYEAEVRASLDGARWSAASSSQRFAVLPPFWRTWWFLLLTAAAAAGLLYLWHRGRIARAVALERVRTHIATDLHDDVGASLSQIAILNEAALARLRRREAGVGNGGGEALPLLETAAQSARDLVDAMSDLVWSVDPKRDRLSDLVSRMRRFAEGVCAARDIALTFDAPAEAARHVEASTRRSVYLVFKESVNNAVKHSACTALAVHLAAGGRALTLTIADDGRGFDPARPTDGHGLASMRARAASAGGALEITPARGKGTTVRLCVPLAGRGAEGHEGGAEGARGAPRAGTR